MSSVKSEINIRLSKRFFNRVDHLVVAFESDDWGTISGVSELNKKRISDMGFSLKGDPSVERDRLETPSDVESLLNVLTLFSDSNGHHPVFTLNFIMFNPDFGKIVESSFSHYFSIDLPNTYNTNFLPIFSVFKRGLVEGVFDAQLHGAEHMNVPFFLECAKKGDPLFVLAAKSGITSFSGRYYSSVHHSFDELGSSDKNDIAFFKERLLLAEHQFESLFGYQSTYFTPPCGVYSSRFLDFLKTEGFVAIKTSSIDWKPDDRIFKRRVHFKKQIQGIGVISRNVAFEPAINEGAVNNVLQLCKLCVQIGTPCIISSHRLNFVSSSSFNGGTSNLDSLRLLLSLMIKAYPDVEFLSTKKVYEKYGKLNKQD